MKKMAWVPESSDELRVQAGVDEAILERLGGAGFVECGDGNDLLHNCLSFVEHDPAVFLCHFDADLPP